MAGKADDLQLNNRQKTRLLSLGLEPLAPANEHDAEELRGDLLCDILRCSLPLAEHRPKASRHTSEHFRPVFGPSLGQLLTDPETDVTAIKRIKDYAKASGKQATSDIDEDVFLAIYFAAIASAKVFRDMRITEHTKHDLVQFFQHFAQTRWIRADLRELFARATEHC